MTEQALACLVHCRELTLQHGPHPYILDGAAASLSISVEACLHTDLDALSCHCFMKACMVGRMHS